MIEQKMFTNSLTAIGKLIENPSFLYTKIILENPSKIEKIDYGSFELDSQHLFYLLHREGLRLIDEDSFIKERNPIIVVKQTKVGKVLYFQFNSKKDIWDVIDSRME